MKIYLYLASLVALLCMAAQPAEAQRISVGKKGRVVVMRTDSTSAQEIVNQDGSRMNRARKTNHLQALAGNLRSDVDIDIPVSKAKQEKTFAVIIANENYEEEVNVEFALNDGVAFSQYCTKTLGIPQENVHVRQDATLNNILAEISWMQNIAKAYGDEARFIFYYAGHGVPDESNGTAYLLPVDGKSSILATGYSIGKLYDQLHALGSQNVTDACFSGSKRGEGMLASARGVAIKSKAEAPKGNMLVISAAQGNETAYPYREKRHGLFTYFLLKKLQETKGNTTFGELFDYVRTQVAQKSIVVNEKSQTPSVNASGELTSTWKQSKLF